MRSIINFKFNFFRLSQKEFFIILLTWLILAFLFYLKINSSQFLLRSDASNEPLIVLSKLFKNNFRYDDFYKIQPYPYITLHKTLLSFLWSNPNFTKIYYYVWLFFLIFFTLLCYYLLFRFFVKETCISICLAISMIIGVFSNYWSFAYIGISDFDSLIARSNFNFIIPLLILIFLESFNQDKLILFFFLLLGICVNVYPAISILSSIVFFVVYYLKNKNGKNLTLLTIAVVLFFIGSIPFVYQSLNELNLIKGTIKNDYNIQKFIFEIKKIYTIKTEENSLGTYRGLFENFLFYPPYLILTSFVLLVNFSNNKYNDFERKNNKIVFGLYTTTYILIFIGWLIQHLNYTLPGLLSLIPRPQYLGNFLIVLGYVNIAIFIKSLRADDNLQISSINNSVINLFYIFFTLIFIYIGIKGFKNTIIFPGAGVWMFFALLIIQFIIIKKIKISTIIIIIILLQLMSGFSYSYEESINFLNSPYRQIHRGLLIAFSALFFILSFLFSYNNKLSYKLWIFLLLVPFSWALIPRFWINFTSLISPSINMIYYNNKENDFVNMAYWVKSHTPNTARFILSDEYLNGSRAINIFKTVSLRSTPLLRGGEYFYFEKEGYNYACFISDQYKKLIEDRNLPNSNMKIFLDKINVDYFIIDKNHDLQLKFNQTERVFENNHFILFKILN
jgi:hypothetical protein